MTYLFKNRNIIIFSLLTLLSGWVGLGVDQLITTPDDQAGSLGMLIWIVTPLITAILLRQFGSEGWQDFGLRPNLVKNKWYYAISLFVTPFIVAIVLSTGLLFGQIEINSIALASFISLLSIGFISNFFKNIFEEFAWRGYLTPRLSAAGAPRIFNHLFTGVIWAGWHLPYWLFFLSDEVIATVTPFNRVVFIVFAIIMITIDSFIYGEIRLATKSIWPAVLMHTVANTVINTLLLEKLISINPATHLIFGLTEGLLVIGITAVIAMLVFRYRSRKLN